MKYRLPDDVVGYLRDAWLPDTALVVMGGQWGSEGKGKVAAVIAEAMKPAITAISSSPNAGHTAYMPAHDEQKPSEISYNKVVTHILPVSSLFCNSRIWLTRTSVIREDVLVEELQKYKVGKRLIIDPYAVVYTKILAKYEEDFKPLTAIASTAQGVGLARAMRLQRRTDILAKDHKATKEYTAEFEWHKGLLLFEATQGFDLSLHWGYKYPYVTSRDITIGAIANDLGIHPSRISCVVGVIRTYPIRVGNARGYSGGCYPDQEEISWEKIGVKPERTTTTGRIRRIFTFSPMQYQRFHETCHPDIVFVNHCDYGNKDLVVQTIRNSSPRVDMIVLGYDKQGTDWEVIECG